MKKFSLLLAVLMVLMVVTPVMAETKVDGNQVTFTFKAPNASQVYLSGNFNGWSRRRLVGDHQVETSHLSI